MKLLVTIVLLALTASTIAGPGGGFPLGPGPDFKECMESSGLEMKDGKEVFQKLKGGEELDPELQKKLGCANKCLLDKRGLWKDGAVDSEAIETKMSQFKMLDKIPNFKESIQECAAMKGTDDCDTAFQVMKCLREKFPFKPPKA
ncbi:Obp56h.2 family protein [Megaselia abdita]